MAATYPTETSSLRRAVDDIGGDRHHHHHHHLSIAGEVDDYETARVRPSRGGNGMKLALVGASLVGAIYATASYIRSDNNDVAGAENRPIVPRDREVDDDDSPRTTTKTTTSVAFLGNSMFYFNDFPRFLETMSEGSVIQDSCLHGGASIGSLIVEGNAMHPQFRTENAILGTDEYGNAIYDYGACTVPQLLLGRDDRLIDPGYPTTGTDERNNTNPCRADVAYREYAMREIDENGGGGGGGGGGDDQSTNGGTKGGWDYVVINDNTRNPARGSTRAHALSILEQFYVPWLLETKSIPVFLWTHAYVPDYACVGGTGISSRHRGAAGIKSTPDMSGLEDVANFTSLTHVGYRAYVDLLDRYLPKSQSARIAPVGLAFLVVYEEDRELWRTLFHCDNLHASPSGSFLQGCVVYHTLFGKMPDERVMISEDASHLWKNARMMQHAWEPSNPFPDRRTAEYLYRVAVRVMVEGYVPKSYVDYRDGEVASTTPSGGGQRHATESRA